MLSPERISVLFARDEALDPALESAWLDALPDARRRQLLAMPETSERRRSLLGSRLLLRGVRDVPGLSGADLGSLRYGPDGAGHLDLPVRFSLSHCAGRVLCAVSAGTDVGVDVEPQNAPAPGRTGLYLNAAERAAANGDPRVLLWFWTRKEAVAKAAGRRGLRMLGQLDVRPDEVACAGRTWSLLPLDLGPGFVAHLACAGPTPPVVIRSHSAESLR